MVMVNCGVGHNHHAGVLKKHAPSYNYMVQGMAIYTTNYFIIYRYCITT